MAKTVFGVRIWARHIYLYLQGQSTGLFLSRGHLAPTGDFIFKSWMDSSYHFVNAAPQWQSFNGKCLDCEYHHQPLTKSPFLSAPLRLAILAIGNWCMRLTLFQSRFAYKCATANTRTSVLKTFDFSQL